MPFVYRLQKILDFRIRKKEEQLLVVQQAQQRVHIAETNIIRNNQEIDQIKANLRSANHLMMESYDKYLHHLWEKAEKLEEIKKLAVIKLQEETEILIELEQAVKVLEKHKEKNNEIYIEEEKADELKKLSEVGVQRHFRQSKETLEQDELIEQFELMEGEEQDEY